MSYMRARIRDVGLAAFPRPQFTGHQPAERTCLLPDSQGLVPLTPLAGTGVLMPCSTREWQRLSSQNDEG